MPHPGDSMPVPEWLILGSFPLRDRTFGRWTESGFPCEGDFAPEAGETFNGASWVAYESPRGRIEFHDPVLPFTQRFWCFAYAFTYVYSPAARRIRLLVGSDNGVVAWLNGKEVHRVEAYMRGADLQPDDLTLKLRKGWNALLFKAPQDGGSWGLRVQFGGADAKAAPTLRCGLKRPSVKQFPGLRRRRNGLAAQWCPHVARAGSVDGRLTYDADLDIFNDSTRAIPRASFVIAGPDGKPLGRTDVSAVPAFTSRRVTISMNGEAWLRALTYEDGSAVRADIKSSTGTRSVALPADAPARVYCRTMTDLTVPLTPKGETVLHVPELFSGQAARVETYVNHAEDLSRDFAWPRLPSQDFSAEQTGGAPRSLCLVPPPGMTNVKARIVFGDPQVRALGTSVRAWVDELGLDLQPGIEAAKEGLRRLLAKDVPGAWQAMRELADRVGAAQPDRRSETVTLVGHAHVDMNWLWTYDETLQCCHDTFRQVLAFMKKYADFCYSQSQPAVYEMIERFDPCMFDQIRRRVAEGRWELLGGFLVEGDTNLASGEGLARALLLGQRYYREHFGRIARAGWLPDNFGHAAQLPQISRLGGLEFFYAHRCQNRRGAYVWQGIDGSRLLTYATPTYNGEVTPALRDCPTQYGAGDRNAMWIYGVGDHGGGPTRRDIERAHAYNQTPGFPEIRCGTAESFFRSLEPHAASYEVRQGEQQYVFEGCYTSIARIKEANRLGENLMLAGELFAAIAALYGDPYPHDRAYRIWHRLAFNQFHDILCGSATHDSNRESIARYDSAIADARSLLREALRRLTYRIDTQSFGQPVVVFNALPRARTDQVEAELFTHQLPPTIEARAWWPSEAGAVRPVDRGQGPYPTVHLVDHEGSEVPAQIVSTKAYPNGHRIRVQFKADSVPGCGYKVFHAFPTVIGSIGTDSLQIDGTSVETPYFKLRVDPTSGHVTRLYDKRRKREVLRRAEPANVLKIYMEKPHGMSAWELGPISAVHTLDRANSVQVVEHGPVRAVIQSEREWNRSRFVQRVIVYRDLDRIDFELDVVWFELGDDRNDAPTLRVAFPLNVRAGRFTCDTPFAAVERPTNGQEVPAQKWIDLSDASGGAALLNDSRYGHRCTGHVLETTLLRASYSPDPYPDQGPHSIRYALWPHDGSWCDAGVPEAGLAFNAPLVAVEATPDAGELPSVYGFIDVRPKSVILSGFKKPEDGGGVILRIYEVEGTSAEVVIRLPRPASSARRVDLLEDPYPSPNAPWQNSEGVHVNIKPHEIVSLRIEF